MQQFIFEIPYKEPEKAFSVFAHENGAVFLDSSDKKSVHSSFSFIGFSPFEKITHRNGITEIKNEQFCLNFKGNPFDVIQTHIKGWKESLTLVHAPPVPFTNGLAGYFSYELARHGETLPIIARNDNPVPDMALGIYDQVIGFDLEKKKSFFCTLAADQNAAHARLEVVTAKLNNSKSYQKNLQNPQWQRSKTQAEYKNDIQTVIDYIHAGDVFQVNLTQKFISDMPDQFDPYAHYLQLRKINPSPFSAFLRMDEVTLSSTSPERFLKVQSGTIETRPIKGTAPDSQNPEQLRTSMKDRAENTMIVDLLRNDLSKVCTPDSVEVPELCIVESYSGLHHLVSSVKGRLKVGATSLDALAACFPGGSITGAPKIRAMEIIEELEPTRRGAYCGTIGYVGFDDSMDTNIAIRTLIYAGNQISLSVGGGIVADSDSESEYQETLVKARKIFESFENNQVVSLQKKSAFS